MAPLCYSFILTLKHHLILAQASCNFNSCNQNVLFCCHESPGLMHLTKSLVRTDAHGVFAYLLTDLNNTTTWN